MLKIDFEHTIPLKNTLLDLGFKEGSDVFFTSSAPSLKHFYNVFIGDHTEESFDFVYNPEKDHLLKIICFLEQRIFDEHSSRRPSVFECFFIKDNTIVQIEGFIRSVRVSKSIAFFQLSDGSHEIQVVLEDVEFAKTLAIGDSISFIAKTQNNKGTKELLFQESKNHYPAEASYPIQKKATSFEFLRTIQHLRTRTKTFGAIASLRHSLSIATHKFFQERDFTYIHTPILTSLDSEGAGELFQVNQIKKKEDFFGKQTFLTVTGQLHAEALAFSHKKVYTFGPTFRAENSFTTRHLAEFWMIEPEVYFINLQDLLHLSWSYCQFLVKTVLKDNLIELKTLEEVLEKDLLSPLTNFLSSSLRMKTYTEVIDILEQHKSSFEDSHIFWGMDLKTEHERFLVESIEKGPLAITSYPKELKAFYMKSEGKTVECFDLLVPGVGELIGGSMRENNEQLLRNRIQELSMKHEDYEWYVKLRAYGEVPHGGFGLGFERLVMWITQMQNIRDVSLFPRASSLCEF